MRALQINGVAETSTLNSELVTRQCEIEERYSLIAASAFRLDSVLVSDDRSFDKLPDIKRTRLSQEF
jgi:predicted nucleic acid-binding protein